MAFHLPKNRHHPQETGTPVKWDSATSMWHQGQGASASLPHLFEQCRIPRTATSLDSEQGCSDPQNLSTGVRTGKQGELWSEESSDQGALPLRSTEVLPPRRTAALHKHMSPEEDQFVNKDRLH